MNINDTRYIHGLYSNAESLNIIYTLCKNIRDKIVSLMALTVGNNINEIEQRNFVKFISNPVNRFDSTDKNIMLLMIDRMRYVMTRMYGTFDGFVEKSCANANTLRYANSN